MDGGDSIGGGNFEWPGDLTNYRISLSIEKTFI
jgi:hypothetical protein